MDFNVNIGLPFIFTLFSFSILLGLGSCQQKKNQISDGSMGFPGIEFSIDTVEIFPAQSSQIGSFYFKEESIYYVDRAYGIVEEFTIEGESKGVKKRELDGPEELKGISELVPTKEGFIISP